MNDNNRMSLLGAHSKITIYLIGFCFFFWDLMWDRTLPRIRTRSTETLDMNENVRFGRQVRPNAHAKRAEKNLCCKRAVDLCENERIEIVFIAAECCCRNSRLSSSVHINK